MRCKQPKTSSRLAVAPIWTLTTLSLAFGLVVVGCASAQQPDDDEISIPLTSSTIEAKAPPPEEPKKEGELDEDTKEQIKVALRRGGEKAQECNKVAKANIVGEGEVIVVIDGQIGKVVDAKVGAPFAGTVVEACIKRSFIDEYALTFEGKLELPYKVTLTGAPKDPKKDPKKK